MIKQIKNFTNRVQAATCGGASIASLCLFVFTASIFSLTFPVSGIDQAHARASLLRFSVGSKVKHLTLTINKSRTIRVDSEFTEVQVGNAKIADVMPLSNKSFYILGKKTGTTNVSIYDAQRKLVGVVDIEISYDMSRLSAKLKRSLRGSHIKVSSLNGNIMLSGSVPNAPAAQQAMIIAQQYAPNAVTNALSIASAQQVMLEVRFIEASRTAGRELGLNLSGDGKGVNFLTGVGLLGPSAPFGSFLGNLLKGGFNADILIQALEKKGLARRLAEPNLIALSGDTASFLAGGEFPFPVGNDNGEIKIEFKKFGVGLSFTPTVLADGLINLKIEPEVSQLDPTTTLRIAGFEIPSLIVRRAKTTVELRDGQSFAIAGLLMANHTKAKRQLPWLGNVPVLGSLFSSSSFEKKETDLVIIITPRLVRPAAPGQHLASPLDNKAPGNDRDFFLKGKMEVSKKIVRLYETGGKQKRTYGHILSIAPRRPSPPANKLVKASVTHVQNFGVDAHVLD